MPLFPRARTRRWGRIARRPQCEWLEGRALRTVFTVTSTDDTVAADGVVTLREAILAANTNAAAGDAPAGDAGLDRIAFDISGSGSSAQVHTIRISPYRLLPDITEPLVIDGFSQLDSRANADSHGAGNVARPTVEIAAEAFSVGSAGLRLAGGGVVVRGLIVNGFDDGVRIRSDGNQISGCFIGVDPSGMASAAIGTGTAVDIEGADNTVGGSTFADQNLLFAGDAVIKAPMDAKREVRGTVIQGNWIGVDRTGAAALPGATWAPQPVSAEYGIRIDTGHDCTIGGTTAASRNLIAGRVRRAISLSLGGAVDRWTDGGGGAVIQGNYLGTDLTGLRALRISPGGGYDGYGVGAGIVLEQSVHTATPADPRPVLIGGPAPGEGNVVGACWGGDAVRVAQSPGFGAPVTIQGNVLGVEVLPVGIYSGAYGVEVVGARDVRVLDNTINRFSAGAVSVPAGETGVLVRDNTVSPSGPSSEVIHRSGTEGPAAPVIRSAGLGDHQGTIAGSVSSAPGTMIRVDFYAAAPPTYGTPQVIVPAGHADVPVGEDGEGVFAATVDLPYRGWVVTAAMTDAQGTTSPLSAPAEASLSIRVTAQPEVTRPYDRIRYHVELTNEGSATAREVRLWADLPWGATGIRLDPFAAGGWVTPPYPDDRKVDAHVDCLPVGTTTFDILVDTKPNLMKGSSVTPVIHVSAANSLTHPAVAGSATATYPDMAPVGAPDSYEVRAGETLNVDANAGVLRNDGDPDDSWLNALRPTLPEHGRLSFHADGSFTYRADADFRGVDQFRYEVSDGILTASVTVSITVLPPLPVDTGPPVSDPPSGPAPDVTGPSVTGVRAETKGSRVTQVVVDFDEALDAVNARNASWYRLVAAGRDRRLGTKDDKVLLLRGATYTAGKTTVTLSLKRSAPTGMGPFALTVGRELADASGNRLVSGDARVVFAAATVKGAGRRVARMASSVLHRG